MKLFCVLVGTRWHSGVDETFALETEKAANDKAQPEREVARLEGQLADIQAKLIDAKENLNAL